jgi:hypothetical protein
MSKSRTSQSCVFLITFIVMLVSLLGRLVWPSAQETLMRVFLGGGYIVLCLLAGLVADRMVYRSFAGWTVLAMMFTPFIAAIFLVAAGPPLTAYDQVHPGQDVETKAAIGDEEYRGERSCPPSGDSAITVTSGGVHSPDEEPWRLICNQCNREIEVDVLDA